VRLRDRSEAGRLLAARLEPLRDQDPVVLALPRGGVPVAHEIATTLDAPLDVLIVRKLGSPYQPELALGAIGENGAVVLNEDLVDAVGVSPDDLHRIEAREAAEIERRRTRYRAGRPMVPIDGRTVIIVDDGLATGATARAAVSVARALGAKRVIVAVPVGAADSVALMAAEADDVVTLAAPHHFAAVGAWYEDFRQVGDDEVERILSTTTG
jgi:putative phosphoribosyl transferase